MHKQFSASGFLYHPHTKQILLQQLQGDNTVKLVLFRGSGHYGKNPQNVFQKSLEKALGATFTASSIHPVYDYIHYRFGEQFIFFVETGGKTPRTYESRNTTRWFSLAKLSKLTMSEQTRHDIIIGERVIRSLMESPRVPQSSKHH